MKKTIAAATVAASIAVGGLTGAVLGTPVLAGAAESAGGAVGWVQDALGDLVDDGTITQAQADAVGTALEEARPARPHGGFGHRGPIGAEVLSEALGLTPEELRAELEAGKTVAAIAGEQGVEVQAVIDAVVAALEEHLDEKVAAGELTQEEADERLAGAEERATALVNGELPFRGGRHHHHPHGHGAGGAGEDPAPAAAA
jgi:hypothetical protein